jgi:hypothetical protein
VLPHPQCTSLSGKLSLLLCICGKDAPPENFRGHKFLSKEEAMKSFLFGLGLGLGLGVLFAPSSGEETRNTIAQRANEFADQARDTIEQGRDKVRSGVTAIRNAVGGGEGETRATGTESNI